MIEHRHAKRVTASGIVSIYHRDTLVAKCKMKDISMDGMAIWAGPLQYHRNTMLEVEIKALSTSQPRNIRLSAMVVYSTDNSLGLIFGQINEAATVFLRNFINDTLLVNSASANRETDTVWNQEVKARRA